MRAHPLAADSVLAVVLFAVTLVIAVTDPHGPNGPRYGARELTAPTVVLAAFACSSLLLRRRFPRSVLAFTTALAVLELFAEGPVPRAPVACAAVIALYTLASRTDRSTTWRIGALTALVLTAAVMLFGTGPWYSQENVGVFAWTGLAAAAGDAVRSRRAYIAAIRERAERAERTREEEAGRRVAEERMRIARELHDVVAHHIALVNVQAGVASHVMDSRPDQAKQALAHVREASRSALEELRATVGLLRQHGDPTAPTEPAPGLGVLDQLIDGFTRAGLPVDLETPPRPDGLPASVDLAAYRIVQEALTNVHKHAGPGARATVRIVRTQDALTVTVLDDGAGVPGHTGAPKDAGVSKDAGVPPRRRPDPYTNGAGTPTNKTDPEAKWTGTEANRTHPEANRTGTASDGGGHGLIGMRERVAALRGTVETGPRPSGGFRVRVRLPLHQSRTGETT
ncbi:sensor histidine kinase [Streptomyces sp. MST-110588]|uniref:sensor histidine kinase n=1 Tax=Streptomyces sp. MST-110588 TaxID=2833628 RepID=UPI001F5D9C58|nr:sensor histidine kinase [Streptomyces sp. MST-110588]